MTAVLAYLLAVKPDRLVATVGFPIRYLAWSQAGHLVAVTEKSVTDIPKGRSRPVRSLAWNFPGAPPSLRLNASGTKAIGSGFLLNLETLESSALPQRATWDGDRLVKLQNPSRGHYRTGNHSLAPGWYVLGFSSDLRYAVACRKEPSDDDTTYLLRLDRRTGKAATVATYPHSSYDHIWLNSVQTHPDSPPLLHNLHLAGDFTLPFFGGANLHPIKRYLSPSWIRVSDWIEWIHPSSPWTLARATLIRDPYHVETLDLWNPKNGKSIRVAKAIQASGFASPVWTGTTLGPATIHWPTRQIAYAVVNGTKTQIFVRPLPR